MLARLTTGAAESVEAHAGVLAFTLAFTFGLAAILLPADIMFRRILDVIFGEAKPSIATRARSASSAAAAVILVIA
jgi:hypothetical protein